MSVCGVAARQGLEARLVFDLHDGEGVWYNWCAMKLDFARRGKQFFFVTLVVAERQPVLSKVVSENRRPELLPLGELVMATLWAVHLVWPMVTVSDFVIMPDHFHFLLIVDYGRVKGVSPLYVAHRVADAVEMAASVDLESTGARAPKPQGQSDERRVMGDELVGKMADFMRAAIEAANEAGGFRVERGLRFGERGGGSGAVCRARAHRGRVAASAALRRMPAIYRSAVRRSGCRDAVVV